MQDYGIALINRKSAVIRALRDFITALTKGPSCKQDGPLYSL
jgi:hypothetical protein